MPTKDELDAAIKAAYHDEKNTTLSLLPPIRVCLQLTGWNLAKAANYCRKLLDRPTKRKY